MYLRTLSLAGFKSFADRTRLEFEPGVNIVVGPNGSGKSNLVDAVAWVMGTQATSVLRTKAMEDVIFSGTATRPSHGRAEVSLTFDNAEGRLPLDLPEVTVTRRLYRDGTSEYEINGTTCRLLDVQELISDSGVGRHQHVIVGQGRIGTILNAKPEEHRSVIEEAAGVIKHRNRRDRSLRRLEQTGVDIARLQDILTEQRRLMRPLKRQARAAEQYDAVKAEARAIRLWLGGEELRRIRGRTATADERRQELAAAISADSAGIDEISALLPTLETDAGEAGRALEHDTAAAARLETTAERLQRIAMVARERRLSIEGRLRGAGERRRDLEAERRHLTNVLAECAAEERVAAGMVERRQQALRLHEDEERSLAEQAQMPAEGVVANLRGDLRAMETAQARDRREAEAIDTRIEVVESRLSDETAGAQRLDEEIRQLDTHIGPVQDEYRLARDARVKEQKAWESAQLSVDEARMRVAQARARVEALEATLRGSGDPSAREHVASLDGIIGSLAGLLDVPSEVALAVDAALGAWGEALVAVDPDSLTEAVASLKASGFGGVPLLVSGHAPDELPAREVAAAWGVDALIDVLGPGSNRTVAARLVGDVVVVEGWSAAWKLVSRHPRIRAVTPEGDLITAFGIRPAVPDGAGHAALSAAWDAQEDAETELARADSLHSSARRAFERARELERVALEDLETLEARLSGATEALARLESSRSAVEAELHRLQERRTAIDEAETARAERLQELRARVAEFEGEEAERQRAWEAMNARRTEIASRRAAAQLAVQEATAALASVEERQRMTARRLQEVEIELDGYDDGTDRTSTIDRLAAVEALARRSLEVTRRHVDAIRERQRTLRERAGMAGTRLQAAHEDRRRLERGVAEAKEEMSALSVELAELRVRDESTLEALRRDADAGEEMALAAAQPDLDDDTDPVAHLETLDAKLRRMGPINPLAAAEYQELVERSEFLEGQLTDLEESASELRKVITALDRQIAEQFEQAFLEIDALFQENFAVLFPGGKGKLTLTDPGTPLETGVEIHAQPLGKKVTRLSLLSGGERSLAALAFLFAVFRARPSPFYVLDEVEAALDDANLRRFLRLVDVMRGSSQLVIVTHQQQTMESADMLYGVTMEPGESSRVLAKRLSDVLV